MKKVNVTEDDFVNGRANAIDWWNKLPMYNPDYTCKRSLSYKYYDREPGNLTGREIQKIYKEEHINQ